MRKRMILETLLLAIALMFAAFFVGKNNAQARLYAQAGIVAEVNREADTVTVETQNGHLWQFAPAEDWMVGDIAALLMDDMGTLNVTDDVIISVRYCGYVSDPERTK